MCINNRGICGGEQSKKKELLLGLEQLRSVHNEIMRMWVENRSVKNKFNNFRCDDRSRDSRGCELLGALISLFLFAILICISHRLH